MNQPWSSRTDDSPFNENSSSRLNSLAQIKLSGSSLSPSLCCFISSRLSSHVGFISPGYHEHSSRSSKNKSLLLLEKSQDQSWLDQLGSCAHPNQTLQPGRQDVWVWPGMGHIKGWFLKENVRVLLPKDRRMSFMWSKRQIPTSTSNASPALKSYLWLGQSAMKKLREYHHSLWYSSHLCAKMLQKTLSKNSAQIFSRI